MSRSIDSRLVCDNKGLKSVYDCTPQTVSVAREQDESKVNLQATTLIDSLNASAGTQPEGIVSTSPVSSFINAMSHHTHSHAHAALLSGAGIALH